MTALVHTPPATRAVDGLANASSCSCSTSSRTEQETRGSDSHAAEAGAWTRKLRHRDNRHAHMDGRASETEGRASMGAKQDPKVIDTSSKKHRFSLRRLFRHEERGEKAAEGPPTPVAPLRVEIPPLFLTREKNGGVTVSGKRVPFTRQAYRRKKKVVRPLPRIVEGRALGRVCSSKSMEEYRRRAYYPAKKTHGKK